MLGGLRPSCRLSAGSADCSALQSCTNMENGTGDLRLLDRQRASEQFGEAHAQCHFPGCEKWGQIRLCCRQEMAPADLNPER